MHLLGERAVAGRLRGITMSLIHYYKQPVLREPVVIVALGGWNDAADAATTALKFLIQRWEPTKIAEIDSEDFFVFTETRPTIKFTDGIQKAITWPTNQFLAYSNADFTHDVILFLGVEPQLKWQTLPKHLWKLADTLTYRKSFSWERSWPMFPIPWPFLLPAPLPIPM